VGDDQASSVKGCVSSATVGIYQFGRVSSFCRFPQIEPWSKSSNRSVTDNPRVTVGICVVDGSQVTLWGWLVGYILKRVVHVQPPNWDTHEVQGRASCESGGSFLSWPGCLFEI